MILVSSCLLNHNTKYDGGNNANQLLMKYERLNKFVPVCPEQLGGLPTPRTPAEIDGGVGYEVLQGMAKVFDRDGKDVSQSFIRGAEEVGKNAKHYPIKAAILKERSPSCGVNQIYDGSFNHELTAGEGVTAALLKEMNIQVYSEDELTDELLRKLLKL